MKIINPETKTSLIQRLKRIEGQVRGIEGMLTDERDCREIMQQLTAVHSAVQSVSRLFLQEYASLCMAEMDQDSGQASTASLKEKRSQIIQDMIQLIDKTP
jgi:CsoR family transcriptional regulator, copper-sensing transcriptional repressor